MSPETRAAVVRRMRTEWPSWMLCRVDDFMDSLGLGVLEDFYITEYRLFEILDDAYNAGRSDGEVDRSLEQER